MNKTKRGVDAQNGKTPLGYKLLIYTGVAVSIVWTIFLVRSIAQPIVGELLKTIQ